MSSNENKTGKVIGTKLLVSVLILLGGTIIGYCLIAFSFVFNMPETRKDELLGTLVSEGYHSRETLRTGFSTYYHENYPDILDYGSDELFFTYAMENPAEGGIKGIIDHAIIPDLSRYWHGYVFVVRPLLLFMDLSGLRTLNLFVQILSAVVLAYLILKKTGKKRYALAWLSVYCLMLPTTLACNMMYSPVYYVSVGSAIFLLLFWNFFKKNSRWVYLFLLSGMATVYFDLLSFPILTWTTPVTLFLILSKADGEKEKGVLKQIVDTVISGGFWAAGYVIFWFNKWILASVISRDNIILNAYNQIKLRSGEGDYTFFDRLESLNKNWLHLSYVPFLIVFVLWIGFFVFMYIRKGVRKISVITARALVTAAPIGWYIVCAQHTGAHPLFAWRNALGIVMAFFFIVSAATDHSFDSGEKKGNKKWIVRSLIAAGSLFVAAMVYYFIPAENLEVNDFAATSFQTVSLPAGQKDAYSTTFKPTFRFIKKIGPLLTSEDADGYAEFFVTDGNRTLYNGKIYPGQFESNNTVMETAWLLKPGKTYEIHISTEHLKAETEVWITTERMLNEFSDSETDTMMQITYHKPFQRSNDTLLYILTWWMLGMVWVVLISGLKTKSLKA